MLENNFWQLTYPQKNNQDENEIKVLTGKQKLRQFSISIVTERTTEKEHRTKEPEKEQYLKRKKNPYHSLI